jgi:tRNA (guanine-N7-)-methyltransferase
MMPTMLEESQKSFMLALPPRRKEMFVTKNNFEKPKFYNSHRSRQLSKKESIGSIKTQKTFIRNINNSEKKILEIGFGTGSSVMDLQKNFKGNYFCIESYNLGIKNINKYIEENNVDNIYVYQGDAIEIIEEYFDDESLDEILIFFPDPWPKYKHRKRRILNNFSIRLFFEKLKIGGLIHFATDHINYAYSAKELISNYTRRSLSFGNRRNRPITNYEKRGKKRKNFIFDIIVRK